MNIVALTAYALKAAGTPAPLMTINDALNQLKTLFGSGQPWRDLTTSGKLPSAISTALSVIGPRAYKLASIAPSGHGAGTYLTISAADVDPDTFGRCIAPIMSWCAQETTAGRLSLDDLDQAIDVMTTTSQAAQKLWKPTVPTDPIIKDAFTSYLKSSGFVTSFATALGTVRQAASAVGDSLSGGAYMQSLNAASTALNWMSFHAPFEMLSEKFDEFKAQRTSTIDTLKKLKALADASPTQVTDDERSQIQSLYKQFSGIDAQSQPVLSRVGLWQNMTPLSGLGVWAVAESVAATVALAVIGALVLLIGMYTALQLNAASKAEALTTAIMSRADALHKSGAITTDQYTKMLTNATEAGEQVRNSAGGASIATSFMKIGSTTALVGIVAIAGYFLMTKKKA